MDDARLFLAIWPDHRLATAFRKLAENAYRDCGGRRMPVESMHLTLAFLGPTPRERIPELRAALGEVEFSPFKLVLDRFGHWEPGIVWLGGDAPPELEALAHDVREAIRAYDFSFDRKRFKPHVTLLRNARRAAQSQTVKPLGWPVDRFLLVESVTESAGARYHILAEFPCLA